MNVKDISYTIGYIIVALYLILNAYINYLNSKRADLHGRHARLLNDLNIVDKYASGIVAAVAVNPKFTISNSKQAAITALDNKLQSIGINISPDTLSRAVENAYQSYKAAGKTTNVASTPLNDATVNNTLDGDHNVSSSTPTTPVSPAKPAEKNDEEFVKSVANMAANTAVNMLRGGK